MKWDDVRWRLPRSEEVKSPPPNSEAPQGTAAGSKLLGVWQTVHEMPAGRVGETAALSGREMASHVFGRKASSAVIFMEAHSMLQQTLSPFGSGSQFKLATSKVRRAKQMSSRQTEVELGPGHTRWMDCKDFRNVRTSPPKQSRNLQVVKRTADFLVFNSKIPG